MQGSMNAAGAFRERSRGLALCHGIEQVPDDPNRCDERGEQHRTHHGNNYDILSAGCVTHAARRTRVNWEVRI